MLGPTLRLLGITGIVDIGMECGAPSAVQEIPVRRMGELPAPDLASLFSDAVFGFVPMPPHCLAKSSIFASLCAQGTIPVMATPFAGEVDGLKDGAQVVSPRSADAVLSGGLEACSRAAWGWYWGHRRQVHANLYAHWLNGMETGKDAMRRPRVQPRQERQGKKKQVINCKPGPAVLLSHPTGNQNVRNALRSLIEHRMLAEYWTALAWDPKSQWNRLLPAAMRAHLARRAFPEVPAHQIRSVPWRETVRLAARSTPLENILCAGERPFSIIGMCRNFDGRVARRLAELRPDIVYAYEGGALQTFREAKKWGVTTIHEQTSSYWHWARKLMSEEAERNPEFANLLPSLGDSDRHLAWKDEELRTADYVFVPSQHVRRTLAGVVAEEKIRVVSYGAPPVRERRQINLDPAHPLQVLFVGNLGQHKGIGYLLQAADLLRGEIELTLVGTRLCPNDKVDEACRRWRWFESLPHAEVMELMQQTDVLVLPSLSEAFGLVVTEALASGLPVIVTPNAGSSEFVHDGREGFVVPMCRADVIADRLTCLNRDRAMLAAMSRQAQRTAAARSWEIYRAELAEAVRGVSWR